MGHCCPKKRREDTIREVKKLYGSFNLPSEGLYLSRPAVCASGWPSCTFSLSWNSPGITPGRDLDVTRLTLTTMTVMMVRT